MADVSGTLSDRVATGAIWLVGQTILSRVTSLASQLVLAWLLAPQHFGQIGMVYTITALAMQLTNPGIDDVLLQKQKRMRRWIPAAFWMGLTFSAAGALLMVIVGVAVSAVARRYGNQAYSDSAVLRMVAIMAVGVPIGGLGMVPSVILRSQMRFGRLASISLLEVVIQQGLTVLFAAWGFGAYSFVLPLPITAVIRSAILWHIVRPPVRAHLAIYRWPSLTSSTGWVFGQRLLYTATSQGDFMILAAIYADQALVGQYFFAFALSTQVIRLLCDNAGAVLLPALNAIRDDEPRMRTAVQRVNRALAAMVVPLVTLQILLAGPAVRLLFAAKWEPSIPLIRLLSAAPLLYATIWPMAGIFGATGRFRASFFVWLFGAISFFAMVAPATRLYGAMGTAGAVACWGWLMATAYALTTYRSISGLKAVADAVRGPWISAAAGAVPCAFIVSLLPHRTAYDVLAIALVVPTVLGIYFTILRRLDRPSVDAIVSRLRGIIPRVKARSSPEPRRSAGDPGMNRSLS